MQRSISFLPRNKHLAVVVFAVLALIPHHLHILLPLKAGSYCFRYAEW